MVGYAMPNYGRDNIKRSTPHFMRDHLKKDIALPETVDDLIDLCDQLYPARSPLPTETHEALMYRGGQRSVVEFLIELKNRSET
jgi:hypothetical protein